MHFFDPLAEYLRHTVRGLRRNPAFTATVIATFALCLGANVVIFSVVHAVLLAPLPYPEPEQLVTMYNSYPKAGIQRSAGLNSVPNYFERRDGDVPAFSEIGAYRRSSNIVRHNGPPKREEAIRVTPSFCRVLGMTAAQGRLFSEEEAVYGKHHVVVVSDRYWRSDLAADPAVIGRTITLDGNVVTIIGVLPPDFGFLSWAPSFWRPLPFVDFERHPASRRNDTVALIARLQSDATIAVAQSQIDALNERRLADDPNAAAMIDAGYRTIVAGLREDHVAGARSALLLLQAGACVLLLIGAFNTANLFLIRASTRSKEWAVKLVLGAGRWRIVSGVTTDSVLLAAGGGMIGLGIGAAALRLLSVLGGDRVPMSRTVALDGVVAVTALSVAIVAGLLLALPVIAFIVRGDSSRALTLESRSSTTTRATLRWRQALITLQVALAFALLTCAGLLGRSFHQLLSVNPGFRPDTAFTASVFLFGEPYREPKARLSFVERWLESLNAIPGVKSAGLGTSLPVSGLPDDLSVPFTRSLAGEPSIWVEGSALREGDPGQRHYFSETTGDYLSALGVPLRAGRLLDADDLHRSEHACVVDEDFAQHYWPEGGALGHRIGMGRNRGDNAMTIVGVVGNVKQSGLNDIRAHGMVYSSMRKKDPPIWITAVVRTEQTPTSVAATMREALQQIDPAVPLENPQSMTALISASVKPQRSSLWLAAIFSGVALLLAAIGVYGVLAFSVAQRQREIGIRLALGALPEQIRKLFLNVGFRVLVCGLAVGGIAAWMTGRLMQNFLFGVSAFEPEVFTLAAGVLGLVVLIAALLPARRAAKASPLEALRHE